jgi:hypothetical protein
MVRVVWSKKVFHRRNKSSFRQILSEPKQSAGLRLKISKLRLYKRVVRENP